MRTIEQNFKKNPHTARFLQTFHSAAYGLPSDIEPADDLLNEVPEDKIVDLRSPAQANLMDDLIQRIGEMDHQTSMVAFNWTLGMTNRGLWTPGRDGNASNWISRLIAKHDALKAEIAAAVTPAPRVEDGRYAVEEDGALHFFKVKNGRRPGFVFLAIQASDDWHAIRNVSRIHAVLALIAADPKVAMARYGQEIGECGRCGRVLTSEYRKLGLGPICIDK